MLTGMFWEIFAWVVDNPGWSASIFAGVVLSVFFALPDDPPASGGQTVRRRPARREDESMNG